MVKERILALDIGDRRIGIAVSDALGITAQPVGMVERVGWGPDVRRIAAYADQYGARTLLCGLPRNMDGTEGGQAKKVRDFALQLEKAGYAVVFWDERMTTLTAERALIEGGVRREQRKALVDQTAASIILQAYLEQTKSEEKPMEHEENNVVELVGEDGSPVNFEHLMTLEHKGSAYILLTPVEPETPDEEGSVVIMRIDKDGAGEDCYIIEEDEEVLDAVFERFMNLMEEEDLDDEEGEDE